MNSKINRGGVVLKNLIIIKTTTKEMQQKYNNIRELNVDSLKKHKVLFLDQFYSSYTCFPQAVLLGNTRKHSVIRNQSVG